MDCEGEDRTQAESLLEGEQIRKEKQTMLEADTDAAVNAQIFRLRYSNGLYLCSRREEACLKVPVVVTEKRKRSERRRHSKHW